MGRIENLPASFKPVRRREGWFCLPVRGFDASDEVVLKLHSQIPLPVQIFCGAMPKSTSQSIYAIQDISSSQLARIFETGSHSGSAFETEKLCEQLENIYRIAPFRPYFIDSAGYKASFQKQITLKQAKLIASLVVIGVDGYSAETGTAIAKTLVAENEIRFWWD